MRPGRSEIRAARDWLLLFIIVYSPMPISLTLLPALFMNQGRLSCVLEHLLLALTPGRTSFNESEPKPEFLMNSPSSPDHLLMV